MTKTHEIIVHANILNWYLYWPFLNDITNMMKPAMNIENMSRNLYLNSFYMRLTLIVGLFIAFWLMNRNVIASSVQMKKYQLIRWKNGILASRSWFVFKEISSLNIQMLIRITSRLQ